MLKFEEPIIVTNSGEIYKTSVDTGRLEFFGDEPHEKVEPTPVQLRISFFLHRWEHVQPLQYACMPTEKAGISKKLL